MADDSAVDTIRDAIKAELVPAAEKAGIYLDQYGMPTPQQLAVAVAQALVRGGYIADSEVKA